MATITVPAGTAGGTVSYRWVRSNGIESEDRMITFAPGQTAQPVSDTWGIGYGDEQPYNDFIQVFAPNYFGNVFSTDVHVTCQGAVTGITGSFTPTSYQCLSPSPTVTVTFTAVFTVIPGPATTINYQLYIGLNGNFGHPYTGSVQVPANATSVTMTKTFTVTRFSPRGTYYGFVSATAVDSSIVTFTKSC